MRFFQGILMGFLGVSVLLLGACADSVSTARVPEWGLERDLTIGSLDDPDQSLTIMQALKMYTYEVAWMSFDEGERGSLEPGKVADLVVLNRDPLAMDPSHLRELQVERLLLAGAERAPGIGLGSLLCPLDLGQLRAQGSDLLLGVRLNLLQLLARRVESFPERSLVLPVALDSGLEFFDTHTQGARLRLTRLLRFLFLACAPSRTRPRGRTKEKQAARHDE